MGERQQLGNKPYKPLIILWLAEIEELEREAANERSSAGDRTPAERKHFNLTPGDSRDYFGVRVHVDSVDERKKGSEPYKPVVTLSLLRVEEELTREKANKPPAAAAPRSDSE